MSEREVGLEEALDDLERIVAKLEEGKLSLEESLVLFEKGTMLVRLCQGKLEKAQKRIESLTGELPSDLG
ncbi:MAG: exodeoxyribonuclease VII small subunit [Methanothrix sp.]|nr:exodeoxyribonuclease VII small subunit [Methanothrix sp.]